MRHLENRHDVIFFWRGWSDLWKWKWANSMACHPRATYHIAGCCHLVNSLSRFQSHMPHCHDHATLQGVRIPSAILKIVFRHILLFLFCLMQFRLWRSAAFVSSPIHLFIATFDINLLLRSFSWWYCTCTRVFLFFCVCNYAIYIFLAWWFSQPSCRRQLYIQLFTYDNKINFVIF